MAEKQQLIEIIHQLQSGDKGAATALYEAYYRDLHFYVLKRVNDPDNAEALTQDTFIEIFETIGTLDDADRFVAWSRQIADRRCELYRKSRRAFLLGKVGASVVDSIDEEKKELRTEQQIEILAGYLDEKKTEEGKRKAPETGIWSIIRMVEPFLRKLLVGIIATVILATIRDIGVDWTHKGTDSTIEETETPEESSSSEETENEDPLESTTEGNDDQTVTELTESDEPTESDESTDEMTVGEGLEYTRVGSYYEVSGVGNCTDAIIMIPKEYNGLPVGSIGMSAFSECSATKIVLPESIQFIEGNAFFGCRQLEEINIPESVINIGDGAFAGCESLTEIVIPKTQTRIGMQMFIGCHNLKKIVIPDGVESIGYEAFAFCYNLTSIHIPASVSGIEGNAFNQCISLAEITVDPANPIYYSVNNCVITKSSKTLRIGCKESIIPADGSVTQIGDYAFVACATWSSVDIPEGITKIGRNAFEAVPLKHVSIPKSMTIMGDRAFFNGCVLETITYAGTSAEWERIEKGAGWDERAGNYELYCLGVEELEFLRTDLGYEVVGIGSYTKTDVIVPAEYQGVPVFAIGESAFENSNLTSIALPEGLLRIETFAFMGCSELTTVVLPDSLVEIGDGAFNGCKKLSDITLPKGLKSIGNHAFIGCREVKTIHFPEGLSSIGEEAFSLCGLTDISITAGLTTIGSSALYGCPLNTISVDVGNPAYYSEGNCLISKASGTLVRGCKNSKIPMNGSVLRIGENAFEDCQNFYDIVIPEGVVSIGSSAFAFCSLKSVTIPESVTEIGNCAFWENRDLDIIYYGGTKERWNMIEKGTSWDGFTDNYIVYCSDGEIKK